MRLQWSDIEQHIPDRGTVYVYHCKRGSGNDRLGITRLQDGTVKAHCFHCGARGTWRPDIRPLDSLKRLRESVKREFHFPHDCEEDISKWPGWACAWVSKYGVTKDECLANSLSYSPRYDCVVIPCCSSAGVIGYQTRNHDRQPKYNSFRNADYLYDIRHRVHGGPIVLVEDVLSRIKVSRQFNAAAILSTHINDGLLAELSKFKEFVVWLDNNNYKVLERRTKALKTLSLLGDVRIVESMSDPKKYTDTEIREAVNGEAFTQAAGNQTTMEKV